MHILLKGALALLMLASLSCLSGCLEAKGSKGPARYEVVTTCGMVTDVVKRVAGSRATVVGLMGNDVDPHTHKPTRNDLARLESANVIFYSGLNLEARLSDTLVRMATSGKRVVPITLELDRSKLLEPEEFEGHYDPHVWNDASLWARTVAIVCKTLCAHDPEGADHYRARAAAVEKELLALHEYAKKSLATIPSERRMLITAHDAFNYFGRAYGVEVHGVQGVTSEHKAGLGDIRALVDLIVKRKIAAIFVEQAFDEEQVQAVVEGARARGHELRVGGKLYSDAMGKDKSYRGTFVGMFDHNVTLITRALGGEAPEKGLNGRL